MAAVALKSHWALHGALGRRDLRGLDESAFCSPEQAWQAVPTAGSGRQRCSCPRSTVPRGRTRQARHSLPPRTATAPSAQGRARVPTDSADSLPSVCACTVSYFRYICNKDFTSVIQTSVLCLRSLGGPFPLGKPCLAGLAGYVSKRLRALDRVGSAFPRA